MAISLTGPRGPTGDPFRTLRNDEPVLLEGRQVALFPSLERVPEEWRTRAIDGVVVALLPGEVEAVLDSGIPSSQLSTEDVEMAHMVAAGLSARKIARGLGISLRSAERRIARLREICGVATTGELIALLARRGF